MIRNAFLAKQNTFALIDNLRLCEELKVRGTRCEVPDCNDQALYLLRHGHTVFVCYEHQMQFISHPDRVVRVLNAQLSYFVTVMTGAAYADPHEVIVYQPQTTLAAVLTGKVDIKNAAPLFGLLPGTPSAH